MRAPHEVPSLKNIIKLSVWRAISFIAIPFVLLLFYFYPVPIHTSISVIFLFSLVYATTTIQYLQEQKRCWQYIARFRFISWYYLSFSIVWLCLLLALSLFGFFLFENYSLSIAAFITFVVEGFSLYYIYSYSLHFMAVNPHYLLIVKKKIHILSPDDIQELHYRNDILIIRLKNTKTISINFLETENSTILKEKIAQWIENNELPYHTIKEALMNTS